MEWELLPLRRLTLPLGEQSDNRLLSAEAIVMLAQCVWLTIK